MSKTLPESERRRLLAKIHIAKKQLEESLDWQDEDYRAALQEVAGVDSAGKLDIHGFKKFLDYLYSLGFREAAPKDKRLSPRSSHKVVKTRKDKAVALWIELAKAGKVRDRSHEALGSFALRFLGKKVVVMKGADPLDVATPHQLGKIITALENWLDGSEGSIEAESEPSADNTADGDGVPDTSP